MIAGPPVLCELYAGTAAVSRWCLGLPLDLVSWLGAKRRVAGELACALELGDRPTLGGLLLCDAGPWGWVWPALLDEPTRAAVVAVLRRWASTCPACEGAASDGCPVCQRARTPGGGPDASDLWAWLASQPPRADLAERVSQQLWLQARSASGGGRVVGRRPLGAGQRGAREAGGGEEQRLEEGAERRPPRHRGRPHGRRRRPA